MGLQTIQICFTARRALNRTDGFLEQCKLVFFLSENNTHLILITRSQTSIYQSTEKAG